MTYHFELDADQEKAFQAWERANNEELAAQGTSTYTGALGGRFTFSFSHTSLGTVVKVRDDLTKTELDLSDYENW
jgi:hypothetical protein